MIEAVFISDLHLHPDEPFILKRFHQFIAWASTHTKSLYILGDFFHVWPGDDGMDEWSMSIAENLLSLAAKGVQIFFMPGNRDFLLGKVFATRASMILLKEPTVITLGDHIILLVHGDRYCTKDVGHQWLRRFTRNDLFSTLFLAIPYQIRVQLVNKVRQRSQDNRKKTSEYMDIVIPDMLRHMQQYEVTTIIHGHIHQSGLTKHDVQGRIYQQFVLSDWDDWPTFLCYNDTRGVHFKRLLEEYDACNKKA